MRLQRGGHAVAVFHPNGSRLPAGKGMSGAETTRAGRCLAMSAAAAEFCPKAMRQAATAVAEVRRKVRRVSAEVGSADEFISQAVSNSQGPQFAGTDYLFGYKLLNSHIFRV